jgi:lipopolysaccharide transport system ATP-binding protein
MSAVIRVQDLGKRYRLEGEDAKAPYRTLRETLVRAARWPLERLRTRPGTGPTDLWALRDVTFEVAPGEVLGVIGRNGAGKSTLLKILSRITRPTRGEVTLHGRVGSLLEVGTGFHPELTGRENISLNGAILGMTRREIARKFDQIVEFAGVERFLDTPVKRYSSGMYVRLAFAVAAHLEPEILLVDEVLAVGDFAFQQKCLGRMGDIARSGRTVLLVSHNLPMLTRLCTRAVWLDGGRLREEGAPAAVIAAYCKQATGDGPGNSIDLAGGRCDWVRRLSLFDEQGQPTTSIPLGGTLQVELELGSHPRQSDTGIVIDLCDPFGTTIARANSRVQALLDFSELDAGRVRCVISNLRLLPGSYVINLALGDGTDFLDRRENVATFSVEPADVYGTGHVPSRKTGLIALEARWDAGQEAALKRDSEKGTGPLEFKGPVPFSESLFGNRHPG